jgi:maltose alpha-D-glucosyltransferase/alpha-amylase
LLTDAFALPQFALGILSALVQGDRIATEYGTIHCDPTSRIADIVIPPAVEMHWLSAEQSNSSVVVGDIAIIKMFRRVSTGPHPEAEMGRHLTEQGYPHVPALLGEIVRIDPDGTRHALAIAQAFVRNQGDAWTWTQDLLARGLSDLAGGSDTIIVDTLALSDYVQFAHLLGARLAEMHQVLRRPTDDPSFSPVLAGREDAEALGDRVVHQLDLAYCALDRTKDSLATGEEDRAPLLSAGPRLQADVRKMAMPVVGETLTRIHGDLHLGQVLVVNGDVCIIDFEGEPAKPVEARRTKDHRLRDVAGIIRSFDYAAAVMRRRSVASHGHLTDERIGEFLDGFTTRATNAFLAGYSEQMDVDRQLLALFLIEKAAYEVVYEAANRPNWLDVPLRGLVRYAALHAEAET